MSASAKISRRDFFKLVGGGIAVFVCLDPLLAVAQDPRQVPPENFNAFIVIGENGRVTVYSGKIEMGQGVLTSQAQMVADELDVALASIDIVVGDTEKCPWDMGTFGSLTTRMFGPVLRAAAANARTVLVTLAGMKLGVGAEKLTVKDGIVSVVGKPSQSVGYGELSKEARIVHTVDKKAVIKAISEFRVMGRSAKRLDGVAKVVGSAKYAADIRIPGMLYARILRPPMHGATLSALDTSGVAGVTGTTLVNRGDLIAVLHADPEMAQAALSRINADWRMPDANVDNENIFDHIVKFSGASKLIVGQGNVAAGGASSARRFETTYQKGYVAHAAIEPHAAVAEIKDGKATIWASTQTPFPARDEIAQALGLDSKNVRVITPFVGGGFGGKSANGQAIEAARLAQITGKPVQVAWTRAEEFFNDTFDPACVVKVVSGTDRDGKIVLWDYSAFAAGDRGAHFLYDAKNVEIRSAGRASYETAAKGEKLHPFAVGPWRAPGANMNTFATESQIDMMAAAAGQDALAFRLLNISDARMHRVLQTVADAFGWQAGVSPSGRGFGIACNVDAGSYVATMAEVKVDPASGHIKIVRIVCAQDMGIVVNPEGAKMQMEGGLTMGLGYTLSEELRFRGGEILDNNFDSYDIPHFSWVPKIEAILVKNDDLPPQGAGEPSITTTGAVIANAVFDATGVRMLRLPMTQERVRQAIAAKNG